ncbi:MAG: M23 family metallopeptidase [Rubricoccaceae bacterium]|nr:M23 family metallopeptidase [Rubricoccaceae bacterium]
MPRVGVLLVLLAVAALTVGARAQPRAADGAAPPSPSLRFPTDHEALLSAEPARFYQGLERNYGRQREWSWEGGTYGYCRNARRTPVGWRYTRFHEGIDIAPRRRDADGEPLDEVRSVDDGRVVYVNANPRASDYGRYVVVEHAWEGSPFYSLYAHLASTSVRNGQRVQRGDRLGVLGYSGSGLDRERAHLHFEVNLLLNEHFWAWRDARRPRWPATHGRYHGYNLAGISPAELLVRSREPGFSITAWLAEEEAEVTALATAGPPPELLARYPWLCRSCEGAPPDWAPSWEVGFTRGGRPVSVEPRERPVAEVALGRVDGILTADYREARFLTRRGPGADLNRSGRLMLSLLFARPDRVPTW